MGRATTSRGKLIQAARTLMLGKGYPATSVDEICGEAGLTKGSFYHFFETKEDLGLALLEEYYREGGERLGNGRFTQLEDPVERALGFVDHAEAMSRELWSHGCLLGGFAVDLAETNSRIRARVSEMFRDLTRGLAARFEPVARAARRHGDPPSPEDLAEQFLSALEGSIILAKAHDDWRHIPRALRNFRRYLEFLRG